MNIKSIHFYLIYNKDNFLYGFWIHIFQHRGSNFLLILFFFKNKKKIENREFDIYQGCNNKWRPHCWGPPFFVVVPQKLKKTQHITMHFLVFEKPQRQMVAPFLEGSSFVVAVLVNIKFSKICNFFIYLFFKILLINISFAWYRECCFLPLN